MTNSTQRQGDPGIVIGARFGVTVPRGCWLGRVWPGMQAGLVGEIAGRNLVLAAT